MNTESLANERRRPPRPLEVTAPIKTGLRPKFILAITLLIFAMAGVFFLMAWFESKRLINREIEKRAAGMIDNLANNLAPYDGSDRAQVVEKFLRNVLAVDDVVYVVVLDAQGKQMAAVAHRNQDLPPALTPTELQRPQRWNRIRQTQSGIHVSDFVRPVGAQPRQATLRLGLSRQGIYDAWKTQSTAIVVYAAVFLFLGVILALFLSHLIVHPIQRLARLMKTVAEEEEEFDENGKPCGCRFRRMGDLDFNIRTHDEIEQLADEFKIMMAKLENSYNHLEQIIADKIHIAQEKSVLVDEMEELNRRNEALIKERTREVVEKNLRLYEISEELQFQKEDLIRANAQLEKTSQLKSEFLASMSHELRTPLNSILGFGEVLQDKLFGDLNERQERYLSNILASGRHLLQLINNILDISKVEAGKMKLETETFVINRILEEVQNIIRTLAYKKNIVLELDLGPEVTMQGDPAKIKQIFYNLLSNAIKFTDEMGQVKTTLRPIPQGTRISLCPGQEPFELHGEGVLVAVSDTGIGIKPEELETIFEEFMQTQRTRRRHYEGTGLGLALTRKLVLLHGGRIGVRSEVNQGSEFSVALPLTLPAEVLENTEEGSET